MEIVMAGRETKAQRLERETAGHARAVAQNLCWPGEPEPLPYTEDAMRLMTDGLAGGEVVRAYTYNTFTERVTHGCFNRIHHNTDGDKICSQTTGGPWFSSQKQAALALEWVVCRLFAERLIKLRSTYRPNSVDPA